MAYLVCFTKDCSGLAGKKHSEVIVEKLKVLNYIINN